MLLMGGSLVISVLIVAGAYLFGTWYNGRDDIEPLNLWPVRPRLASSQPATRIATGSSGGNFISGDTSQTDARNADYTADDIEVDDMFWEQWEQEEKCCEEEIGIRDRDDVFPSHESEFPEVPDGFPLEVIWKRDEIPAHWSEQTIDNLVLMHKVLIKLWNQGDQNWVSVSMNTGGDVYPHYPNTLYLQWAEWDDSNGVIRKYISSSLGPGGFNKVDITPEQMQAGEIPYGIQVLDYDEDGIDPYSFLN